MGPGVCQTLSLSSTIGAGDFKNTVTVSADPCDKNGLELKQGFDLVDIPNVTDKADSKSKESKNQQKLTATVYQGWDQGQQCSPTGKTSSSLTSYFGKKITYCIKIENTGDYRATVSLSNQNLGYSQTLDSTMTPREKQFFFLESTLLSFTQQRFTSTGYPTLVDGTVLDFQEPLVANSDVRFSEIKFMPKVSVINSVYPGQDNGSRCMQGTTSKLTRLQGSSGAPITYCFAVTNSGDSFLRIQVSNPLLGNFSSTVSGLLGPGQNTYVYVEDVIKGTLKNTVLVAGITIVDDNSAEGVIVPGLAIATATAQSEVKQV
jgi:hypothetical protein